MAILNINLKKLLQQFGKDTVREMVRILTQHKKSATGNLIKSVRSEIKNNKDEGLELIIKYPEYGKYVDEGRKPGSFPPSDPIKKWCKVKGIPDTAVFPIMRKIFNEGIDPVNFTAPWTTKGKELNEILAKAATEDVTVELTLFFKDNNVIIK